MTPGSIVPHPRSRPAHLSHGVRRATPLSGACGALLLAIASAACSSASEPSGQHSADSTGAPADPVSDVWGSVDYLPWEYSPDGCFARSFYVSMEFASRGVPVNQLVLNLEWEDTSDSRPQFSPIDPTQPGDPPVTYQGNAIHWDYHIAALLSPPVVNVPTIFDKAMESTPVSQDTWIANVNSAGIPQSQADADGGLTPGYNEFTTYASSYVGVAPSLHDNWASVSASDLASMPAFQADQVQLACNTVWSVFDCMQLDDSDPRRQQLVDRTNALLTALSGMGLVQGFDGNPITCGPTSFTCAPQ